MNRLTPIDREIAHRADGALVEGICVILEAALDLSVDARARDEAEALAALCQDAEVLCRALVVMRRRLELGSERIP